MILPAFGPEVRSEVAWCVRPVINGWQINKGRYGEASRVRTGMSLRSACWTGPARQH